MRPGGEAAWWLLSGITSVGAVLQHYHSKPLCLCLSFSNTDTHTHTRTYVSHTQLYTGELAHSQLDGQIVISHLLCTGMC